MEEEISFPREVKERVFNNNILSEFYYFSIILQKIIYAH